VTYAETRALEAQDEEEKKPLEAQDVGILLPSRAVYNETIEDALQDCVDYKLMMNLVLI
jgi:hypothetical protein